jgi:F-type H+-transporting ATPase subunit gamma
LSRATPTFGRVAAGQPVRGMATAEALRSRIASVKNIAKITSAMKMVAVCKLRLAQENLAKARTFAQGVSAIEFKPSDPKKTPKTRLWIGITSDRGLCGAINSSISRSVRDSILAAQEDGLEHTRILLYGDKGKSGLERTFKKSFTTSLSETSKFKTSTFKQCAELCDFWTSVETDVTSVYFQKFKSMIAYTTTEDKYWSYASVKDGITLRGDLLVYETEGNLDIWENFHQFQQCVKLYHYFAENETSTLSARMTAMDNSSTNAKEMIEDLSLVLNRNRQAKITTELSEIISGAAASDEVN